MIHATMAALEAATQQTSVSERNDPYFDAQTLVCWVAGSSPAMVIYLRDLT
jgi:hypothetical protein